MSSTLGPILLYTSRGDVGALMLYPYLYNSNGEWIGWVTRDRQVYSVQGEYIGTLDNARRIVRQRSYDYSKPRLAPPPAPDPIRPPAHFPLAPLLPELPQNVIDVLDEAPELLPPADFGTRMKDLD